MKLTRKALARILVAALAPLVLVLLFCVLELAARFLLKRVDPRTVFISETNEDPDKNPTVFDYKRFWKLRPNLRAERFVGTTVNTNKLGIRYDSEIGAKDQLTIRIVTMGDSVTFGYGVPYEPAAGRGNYSFRLERQLRERHPDWKFEVIPLACPGYTTAQGRFWLEDTIEQLSPDIVITCFAWNDCCDSLRTNNQVGMRSPAAQRVRWLAQHSQLVTRFVGWRSQSGGSDLQGTNWMRLPRTTLEDFILDHQDIYMLAKKHRAEMGVILPIIANITEEPHEGRCIVQYREKLRIFCEDHQLPALLVPELTEAHAAENARLFTGERIHPNEDGHRLLAERLYPAILPLIDTATAKRRDANKK